MRLAFNERGDAARRRGEQARFDMRAKFSREAVGDMIAERLRALTGADSFHVDGPDAAKSAAASMDSRDELRQRRRRKRFLKEDRAPGTLHRGWPYMGIGGLGVPSWYATSIGYVVEPPSPGGG